MRTAYKGIDYGLGKTNIDKTTGIRFGVISQHTVGAAWYDNAEGVYGDPTCPQCGSKVVEYDGDKHLDRLHFGEYCSYRGSCDEYACEHCKLTLGSDYVWPEEPQGYKYEGQGYVLTDCLDSDIFVIKSPYFTYGQYCSPCVPGAVNLDSAIDNDDPDAPHGYCLGHEWFEDGKAPYRVYSVETGKLVEPETT